MVDDVVQLLMRLCIVPLRIVAVEHVKFTRRIRSLVLVQRQFRSWTFSRKDVYSLSYVTIIFATAMSFHGVADKHVVRFVLESEDVVILHVVQTVVVSQFLPALDVVVALVVLVQVIRTSVFAQFQGFIEMCHSWF